MAGFLEKTLHEIQYDLWSVGAEVPQIFKDFRGVEISADKRKM
jgi:hypothetical protein